MERSCLLKIDGKVVERPQHMLMRVAVDIHGDNIDAAIETYDLLSQISSHMHHQLSLMLLLLDLNCQVAFCLQWRVILLKEFMIL